MTSDTLSAWVIVGVGPFEAVFLTTSILGTWWLARRGNSAVQAVWLRVAIVASIAAALTGPSLVRPGGRRVIELVDRSDSVLMEEMPAQQERSSLRPLRIEFGDSSGSDLAQALDLAGRAAGEDGHVIVYSDGHVTGEDHARTAAELAGRGIQVDVVPVPSHFDVEQDVGIAFVEAPSVVRAGDPLSVVVATRTSASTAATLTVSVNGKVADSRLLEFTDHEVLSRFDVPVPKSPGEFSIDVSVVSEEDARPANDRATARVIVIRPPSVLVVGEGAAVVEAATALQNDGLRITISGPARVPIRGEDMREYDAIVLVDTPAEALALDQRAAIEVAVQVLGLGLLLTGGRQSFALGGWRGTALERLSPLSLDPAPRTSRESVTLALLIDRSASMGGSDGRFTKLALAREAALLAAEALEPQDRVGVVAYDENAEWAVEVREVGAGLALAELEIALSQLEAEGGTRILSALQLGLERLGNDSGATRHAVLLSDGRDLEEDDAATEAAAADAAAAGVTLSTIAIGADADEDLLQRLARIGRGRFHAALDPSDLPGLVLDEGEIVGGRVERRESVRVRSATPRIDPILTSIDLAALPQIAGYLALEPHSWSRTVLESDVGDPLLVLGQRGLGRVAAWSSDLGEDWTASWVDNDVASKLWGRMVRSIARPLAAPFHTRLTSVREGVRVEVDLSTAPKSIGAQESIEARLVYTDSQGTVRILPLEPETIGAVRAVAEVPSGDAVTARVEFESAEQGRIGWPLVLKRDPSPELLPRLDAGAVLRNVAEAGGGEVLTAEATLESGSGRAGTNRISLWPLLAAFAACIWPIDIALHLRRGTGFRPSRN